MELYSHKRHSLLFGKIGSDNVIILENDKMQTYQSIMKK